jgi:hypothetical protein
VILVLIREPFMPMNTPSTLARCGFLPKRFSSTLATGVLAVTMFTALLPATAQAQPPFGHDRGPGRDLHVDIDPRLGPHFFVGPDRRDFYFVHPYVAGAVIRDRDSLLDLLLRPTVDAVAWGLGEITTDAVANILGVPVHTVVYGLEPGVPIVSTLPPGYFSAEAVPQNVALVSSGPAGPVVLVPRVPAGAFIAYQTSPTGTVLSECVVVPPVQQMVMAQPTTPAPAVVMTAPAMSSPAPAPAPAPAVSSSTPMSSKTGKIVYDSNGKPIGVIVVDADGKQEFVPLQ